MFNQWLYYIAWYAKPVPKLCIEELTLHSPPLSDTCSVWGGI